MTAAGQPTDEELMQAYAEGMTSAFERLFQRYRSPLFTFLLHHVGGHALAEDMFQETFFRLIRARAGYRPAGSFRTWLYTIARNVLTDDRRRAGVRPEEGGARGLEPLSSEGVADPVAASQASELGQRIEVALGYLPEDQREVFLLRERAGLDLAAIAEVTGARLPTVKSRMRYALVGLRRRLEGELASLPEGHHE